jgi:hypothetical protein
MIDHIRTSAPNPGSRLENGVDVDRLNSSCFCISLDSAELGQAFRAGAEPARG